MQLIIARANMCQFLKFRGRGESGHPLAEERCEHAAVLAPFHFQLICFSRCLMFMMPTVGGVISLIGFYLQSHLVVRVIH